jgi:hypothetical protein
MLEKLHAVKHVLLYAIDPDHTLVRFDTMHDVDDRDDAFTAGIKALMRSLCKRGILPLQLCPQSPLQEAPSEAESACSRCVGRHSPGHAAFCRRVCSRNPV